MINEELFGGRTEKEFVEFMSDMLIEDNALANNILKEYFNEGTPECWNLRTNIIVEWFGKMQKLKNNGKTFK